MNKKATPNKQLGVRQGVCLSAPLSRTPSGQYVGDDVAQIKKLADSNIKKRTKMKYITILISCLIFLSSCDNFERKFYHKIDEGQVNAIKNGFDIFDLSTITDFEWDSVF